MSIEESLDHLQGALRQLANEHAEHANALYTSMHGTIPPPGTALRGPRLYGFKGDTIVLLDASTGARIIPTDVMRHDGRPFWFEAHAIWDATGQLDVAVTTAVRTMGGRQIPRTSIARRQLEQELDMQMAAWADQHAATLAGLRSTLLHSSIRGRAFELLQVARRAEALADDIADSLAELVTSNTGRPLYRQLRNSGLEPWDAYQAVQVME